MSFVKVNRLVAAVIATTEIFFQPDIGADEKITTAHFLDLELGLAEFAIVPGNRHYRPTIATHNCLEWDFDGQIEMRRHERTTAVDHVAPIGFESVGRVIERYIEAYPHK